MLVLDTPTKIFLFFKNQFMTNLNKMFNITPIPENEQIQSSEVIDFESVFKMVIDRITIGDTLSAALESCPVKIGCRASFLAWIHENHERSVAFALAKVRRTDTWADQILDIANDIPEEETAATVSRAKLQIDTLKWLMTANNRKEYGDKTSIEVDGKVSIISALDEANKRLIDIDVIDMED